MSAIHGSTAKAKTLAFCSILAVTCFSCLSPALKTSAVPTTIVFDSSQAKVEKKIPVDEIAPDFPKDWSGYQALVLELRASSPHRVIMKIYTHSDKPDQPSYSRVLLHPYPEVWIRAAIPVAMLAEAPKTGIDMAAVGNRSRPGYYIGLWGPFVPLKQVESIAFEMEDPIGSPKLEVRSVKLVKESPGDAVLDGLPVVDKFGQYTHGQWLGKSKSDTQLKESWVEEAKELAPGAFGYCKYGGYKNTKARATGFFRVEKIDGKWWFVDPDGHLFLSVGSDVIQTGIATPAQGRDYLFQELPPSNLQSRSPHGGDRGISFFTWNLARRFGDDWTKGWVDFTLKRMDDWGLNTIGNWSDPKLWEASRKPYVIPLASWQTKVSYLGLPDVYSDEFVQLADQRAEKQCAPRKNDPWLLGYFLANEPPFPQKDLLTAELILSGPETATKAELKKWLQGNDTPERRREFISQAFDRYIQVTSAAVKKYDPNHLNLGMRSGGRPTEAEIKGARAFDVYSVNIYNYEVPKERVQQIAALTGKPILIGEFHMGTPGRGMAPGLVQVKDHAERGVAYRYYVEQAFSMPELIGTHWFQWVDEPCTGRSDGENYNIGLVDVTDRPYPAMVSALKETHKRLYQVHEGEIQPFDTKAQVK